MNADKIIFVGRVIDLFNWVTTVMASYTYTLGVSLVELNFLW